MKKLFTFCVSLLAALSVFAYDFQSGDLFYNITSSSAPYTVEVTYEESGSDNYSGLTTATIPASVSYNGITYSVTSIGESAFNHSKLTTITIPNTITSIGDEAFYGCSSLTSITIPNSVTSIGIDAFLECESLTSVTIGNSVTTIGKWAFVSCFSLTSITIPNSVTSIGAYAFYECTSLTSITCEATTPPTLGSYAFPSELTTAYIPCGTKEAYEASAWASQVGEFIEEDCPEPIDPTWQITYTSTDGNIVTPNATDVFGANIVSNTYENGVGTITFDGPVTSIGDEAFNRCSFLTSITIPESVMSIGRWAFCQCDALTSIAIPDGVTSIGDYAFRNCTSLTSITIPNSVTNIGRWVFAFGSSLTSIVVEKNNTTYDSRNNCNAIIETATNTLVAGCHNTIIPNSVTSIGSYAFAGCSSLLSITIPDGVTSIGDRAFRNCTSLTSITIPNSITSIGYYAFLNCSYLDSIYVEATTPPALEDSTVFASTPSSLCVIPCGTLAVYEASDWANYMGEFVEDCVEGQQIYYTSTNDSIVMPYNVNAFDANIVSNIYENGVGTITFDAPITSIGEEAFQYCSSLTSITIPNSVTSIGNLAFRGCLCLSSITIPNSVTNIESHAFRECSSLKSITIPSSVTGIGKGAFEGAFENYCGLVSITVDSDNRIYDSRENCNAIIETATNTLVVGCQNTIIPNSVTIIGERAFRGSTFTSITIPSSVTSIEYLAFFECDSLDAIYMEAITPPTLGNQVFDGAASFSMHIPCGSLAAYEASDWASQVDSFEEEGCPVIQMCGDDLYWEYADGVLTITGTGDMYDYAADTDVPWYDVRGNIKTVSLPDAMTKIGQNAFYKCTAMTTINMPTSLTAIGEKAFAQDTKLTGELTLPASLTTIDERAFFNCKAVTAFHIEATTPPTLQDKAFDYVVSPIHVPCGYGHVYGKHTQWGMLNLEMCELLQDNVYYYPIDGHTARAVTYHSNPTDTIVIPSAVVIDGVLRTVTEVADFAFTDCDNLPAIYFNEGLEHIGERAFVRCYGLKGTITLPTTLTTIGERAFSYCDNVEKYLLQAMTPPVLGEDVFTGNNKNALFYISCEAMDDYKVATNWSSLKSRLRDACLNIYHYNTELGANGVHTTEDTLVASIYYRRQFTPYRWETLYLPFEVDRVTVLEDGEEFDLRPWNIITGGDYYLAKPNGMLNLEILFDFTDELEAHTPYIIQFVYDYYRDKIITFYGKESWNKLSTSFEVLSSSTWMQIAGNTTLQDQLLEKPVYMLRSGLDFILQKTTTTLHPFECYVMPYTAQSGAPARMSVRLRDDIATAVESVKGNESHLTYTVDGYTLTVYPQGQAFSIYSLNGALIYSCEAGKEAVDCELNSGCYLLHAGTEAHKIML